MKNFGQQSHNWMGLCVPCCALWAAISKLVVTEMDVCVLCCVLQGCSVRSCRNKVRRSSVKFANLRFGQPKLNNPGCLCAVLCCAGCRWSYPTGRWLLTRGVQGVMTVICVTLVLHDASGTPQFLDLPVPWLSAFRSSLIQLCV